MTYPDSQTDARSIYIETFCLKGSLQNNNEDLYANLIAPIPVQLFVYQRDKTFIDWAENWVEQDWKFKLLKSTERG